MDLLDRALLLNPDGVEALLDGIVFDHAEHGFGRMQDCDRAVCRLADELLTGGNYLPLDEVERREEAAYESGEHTGETYGYEEGYDVGYGEGLAEGRAEANAAG